MQVYKELSYGTISLNANHENKHLIVIVDSNGLGEGYSTGNEPGPADVFDNLQAKWEQRLPFAPNVAVISFKDSYVRESSLDKLVSTIETCTKKLIEKMEIKAKNVGVIVCSTDLAKKFGKDCYNYLNVLIRNTKDDFALKLPINSKFAYTLSIPSHLWLKGGSIKEDGAGVNLLGFVVRAAEVVLFRQTEGSILEKMKAYHDGNYGKLKIVKTIDEFKKMMKDLRSKKYISIDTEADSLNRINNTILAHQYTTVNKKTDIPKMWVLPVNHKDTPWGAKELEYIIKTLKYYYEVECKNQIHVYQNAKFDFHQHISLLDLKWYAADIYDVSAGSFSLEENQKFLKLMNTSGYSLEAMENRMEYTRPSNLVIHKKDRGKMSTFSIKDIAEYGVIDVLTPLFIMFEQIEIAKNRGYPNFSKFIRKQIGIMLNIMTVMEHNGIQIDMDYLREIASPIGPLSQQIRDAASALANSEAAKQANDVLLSKSSFQNKGLFGNAKKPSIWNIRDTKHLGLLFFEILGLQPLGYKANGEGKLNSAFQKVYRHTKEVSQYTTYSKLIKLKSAFATAIYKVLVKHPDMKHDGRLRPTFTYTDVLTGRSCFVGKTLVRVMDERFEVPIKDLKEGDYIQTFNPNAGFSFYQPIIATRSVEKNTCIVTIKRFNDYNIRIECTPDHLFLTEKGEWVEAAKIPPYTRLATEIGEAEFISAIETGDKKLVYDIQVEEHNNFIAEGMVVHNSTIKPSTQQLPTHGKLAKIIKTQFAVKKGRVRGKRDMSGHEVRVSGNLSLDPAICKAVDTVNDALMRYRLADETELEAATKYYKENGDLHVQNYLVFYDVLIDKKDPRRQDAKSAVFAVTYGSLAKSIGRSQHQARLFEVEDTLLNPNISEKDRRKLEKELNWLRSEEAEQFYYNKASDLLDVLQKKWGVLTEYIEDKQAEAQVNNVVFGPHGRPRHLWAYLFYDKFIHFAMNRRVFNSLGQGYASDYGYASIYLEKKAYWDLFQSRGYDIDILHDNAVHDSSMADMDFRMLPLYTYIAEHSAISLPIAYYKKTFGISPKTLYGFDLEAGVNEADMESWNQRPEGLVSIIEKYAPQSGVSDKVVKETLHDWKILSNLRWRELHSKNPWECTLYNDNVYDSIVHRLKCLK